MPESVELMKAKVGRSKAETQKKCRNYHDKKVLQDPEVSVSDEVCLDRPQHITFPSDSAEEFARKEYKNIHATHPWAV